MYFFNLVTDGGRKEEFEMKQTARNLLLSLDSRKYFVFIMAPIRLSILCNMNSTFTYQVLIIIVSFNVIHQKWFMTPMKFCVDGIISRIIWSENTAICYN